MALNFFAFRCAKPSLRRSVLGRSAAGLIGAIWGIGFSAGGAVAEPVAEPWPEHPLWPAEKAAPAVQCTTDTLLPSPTGARNDRGAWQTNLWPGGVVAYAIDPAVTQVNRDRLRIAMDELSTVANVTFVPRTTETAYLNVRNSTGNNSFIGRTGGAQTVNLFNWDFRYIVIHELMHALGTWHEQNRTDRDTYVTINLGNVCQTCCGGGSCNGNFTVQGAAVPVGAYDFQSIMHYSPTAFSTNGMPTIQAQPAFAAFQSQMGNLSFMSQGDKDGIVSRYGAVVDDAFEPNNTQLAAAALPSAGATNLKLYNDDFFSFTSTNSVVSIIATAPGVWAPSNASVRVVNAAGTVLGTGAFINDGAGGARATISGNFGTAPLAIRVSRTQPWGGSYRLIVCKADFNGVNGVTVQDIFDFLAAWFSGSPNANFNGVNGVTLQDIFDFLAAWFVGC